MSLGADKSPPELSIRLTSINTDSFIDVINEGFRSEVIFIVRTFKSGSSGSFLKSGRKTTNVIKTGRKDFLTGRYYIQQNGKEQFFTDPDIFAESFFSTGTAVPKELVTGELTAEIRVKTDLIKRPQPLALLDPFLMNEKTDTGWVEYGD